MAVWVDAMSPKLQLERATTSFMLLAAPSDACPELLPWVARSQRNSFEAFVQKCANMNANGRPDLAPVVFEGLRLKPQHLCRFRINIAVTVEFAPQAAGVGWSAETPSEPGGSSKGIEDVGEPWIVRLTLRDPVLQQCAEREQQRSTGRGTAASVASGSLALPGPVVLGSRSLQTCRL
mmetsp:Transcript_109260/g.308867  ORF Transcript_109260/g.308867 Transcript_109260/m.308867 type:complete len:178 (+) Transcript_109260:1-534(+)